MARKDKKDPKDEGNLLDLKALDPANEKLARGLGYKERVSVRNIERSVEGEKKTVQHSHLAALVLGVVAIGFVIAGLLSEERRENLLGVAVFIALWAVVAMVFARRSRSRIEQFGALEKVVRERLGK